MTIVDPSHPKAQMALEGPNDTASSSNDLLPPYEASATDALLPSSSSSSQAGPSSGRSLSTQPFAPEELSSLNPASRKKLISEADRRGLSIDDYNFTSPSLDPEGEEREIRLPSFADEEQASRITYSLDSKGNIVSFSNKLNSNPNALLRFLKIHAETPPSLTIHLRGTHNEWRTETVHETDKHGKVKTFTKQVKDEVEDFDFYIDASEWVEKGLGNGGTKGLLYEVGGWEPVYRGGNWKVVQKGVDEEGGIRLQDDPEDDVSEESHSVPKGKWKWVKLRKARQLAFEAHQRTQRGLPGFVDPRSLVDIEDDESRMAEQQYEHPALMFRSHWLDLVESHSGVSYGLSRAMPLRGAQYDSLIKEREARETRIRKVVEQYCKCKSDWKELKVEKEVYGWRMDLLQSGIRSIVTEAYHQQVPDGTVQIAIRVSPNRIVIRPENWISKILSAPVYLKVVLSIFLIYPVVLLLSYLVSHRFHNLRVAFPLTRWRRIPNLSPETHLDQAQAAAETMRTRDETGRIRVAQVPSSSLFQDGEATTNKSGAGWVALVGIEEAEAMKRWQEAIQEAVRSRLTGQQLVVPAPSLAVGN